MNAARGTTMDRFRTSFYLPCMLSKVFFYILICRDSYSDYNFGVLCAEVVKVAFARNIRTKVLGSPNLVWTNTSSMDVDIFRTFLKKSNFCDFQKYNMYINHVFILELSGILTKNES